VNLQAIECSDWCFRIGGRSTAAISVNAANRFRYCKNSANWLAFEKATSLFGEPHYRVLVLSLMPLYLGLVCVVYAFCLLKVFFAAVEAPIGYEDAKGFHYGMQSLSLDSKS